MNEPQEYLYYSCDPPVFHVSVNSGNVVVDADFVAKVSSETRGLAADNNKCARSETRSAVFSCRM
jgi:hypothetical protein